MNILVPIQMAIGDSICATAALASLKTAWPDCRITVLADDRVAEIFIDNKFVDECIVGSSYTYKKVWKAANLLRKQKFEMGICFDGRTKTLLAMWLGGVKNIVYVDGMYSHAKPIKRLLSNIIVKRDNIVLSQHVVFQYKNLVEKITKRSGAALISMGIIPELSVDKANSVLSRLGGVGPIIVFSTGSSTIAKRWSKDKITALAKDIYKKHSARLLFLGALHEFDYNEEIIKAARVPALNLCGKLGLKDTAALLKKADCLVSMCTGTAHIAAAIGLPAVMIYTCSSFRTWYPFGVDFIPACSFEACATGFCDSNSCNNFKCVNNLEVEDVMQAFEAVTRCFVKAPMDAKNEK